MLDSFLLFCQDWGYLGLTLAAFIAGSVFPFSSEVVMTALLKIGLNPWLCMVSATIGNVMGGMTCYLIGRAGKPEWITKYLKVSDEKMAKAMKFMDKYGVWAAFFAFVPYIGTAIVIALGLMRSSWVFTLIAMTAGKFLRYLLLYGIFIGIVSIA